jgi:hypothetical protein
MQNKTETLYGVARGEKIIGTLNRDVNLAIDALPGYNAQLESLGVDADARVVEVEVKTTYGRPKAYKAPEPEARAEDASA